MEASALYVHLPFCTRLCAYCDFPKVLYRPEWSKAYLEALFVELQAFETRRFASIYVGGGTPTALSEEELGLLLSKLRPLLTEGGEFSVEGNPESLTPGKAKLLAQHGVNRVSLGVQSASPRLLALMKRHHDFAQAQQAFSLLREAGITNLNADMIYALPGETMAELKEDIRSFLSLKLPHLSAYSLILEPGTEFAHLGLQEQSEDAQADQYEAILSAFRAAGYARYEVSNFALPGFECRHNLTYWEAKPYEAVGLGAAGYAGGVRYANTRSLSSYLKRRFRAESEEQSPEEELEGYLLCRLRLAKGFALADFASRFGTSFFARCPGYQKEVGLGLLCVENGRVFCSDQGLLLLDSVLLSLL